MVAFIGATRAHGPQPTACRSSTSSFMNIIGSTLRAVIVAHLAEPSLLISEDPGSNPTIGKIFITFLLFIVEKTKIQKKRTGFAN